jgi:hypothetical protein
VGAFTISLVTSTDWHQHYYAFACLTFPFVEANPTSVARIYIVAVDPIACIIGYWIIHQRLHNNRPVLADIGFSILVLGTFFYLPKRPEGLL